MMTLNGILAFMNLGTGEIILIVAVILLLFGGKKIPELMRGLGKGVKSFKQGMNEMEDELKKPLEELDKDKKDWSVSPWGCFPITPDLNGGG